MERSAKIMIVLTGVVIALFIGLQIWTRHKTDQTKVKPPVIAQKQEVERIKTERDVYERVSPSVGTEVEKKPKQRGLVKTETSTFGFTYPQSEQQYVEETTAAEEVGTDWRKYIDENGNVTDLEKFCLARMHSHGWYKPEDVPIIYERPPEGNPDGVYIWREYVGDGVDKPIPEYVKERGKELKKELDKAVEMKDAREMFRITRELDELYRPYKSWVKLKAHFGQIPRSWYPYFIAIYEFERDLLRQELMNR